MRLATPDTTAVIRRLLLRLIVRAVPTIPRVHLPMSIRQRTDVAVPVVNQAGRCVERHSGHVPGGEAGIFTKSLGGQSGGLVYRVIDANPAKGEPFNRMELVGFIDRQIMGDLILAKPAGFVRADGTLTKAKDV